MISIRSLTRTGLGVAAMFLLAACGADTPTAPVSSGPRTIRVTPTTPSVLVGQSVQLAATALDADGETVPLPVTWASLTPSTATVDPDGRATGVAAGEATIEVRGGQLRAEVRLTVRPVPATQIVLDASELVLDARETARLVATLRDANGGALEGRSIAWTSSTPSVATVDPTGRVTAVGEGRAVIAASAEGLRAEATVIVRPVAVARVVLSVQQADLEPGEELFVVARPEAADGTLLEGRPVAWASSTPAVVDPRSGNLLARMTGRETITVWSEGKSAELVVTVHPRPSRPLIFDRVSPAGNEIFVRDLTGAETRINAGNVSRHPSANARGERIVFAVSQHDLTTGALINDLFAVDRTGLNIRHLTSLSGVEMEPVWSPDGSRIAFSGTDPRTGSQDIYVMNADGSGLRNVTTDLSWTTEMSPAWSPDGANLAFVSITPLGNSEVYTMAADGSARTRITAPTANALHPTWSPDGMRLAVTQRFTNTGVDVVIHDLRTGSATQLAVPGDQIDAVWSPNGEHFAYSTSMGADEWIGTMRVTGAAPRLRTKGRNAAWILP